MTYCTAPNILDLHLRLVGLQGEAADALLRAERQELSAQLQADGQRRLFTEELGLARRRSLEAWTALTAWTTAAKSQSAGTVDGSEALPVDVALSTPGEGRQEELAAEYVELDSFPLGAELLPLEFDLDLEEVDDGWTEAPSPWDAPERVSQRDHARSCALELVTLYHWETGLDALTDVLDRPRWGQLRTTIERLIRQGMTPAEFELAWALRTHFRDQPELNVVPCRRPLRTYFDTPGLRWSVALTLARGFPGHDAELLLTRLVAVSRALRPEDRHACWSDRLEQLMDALPEDIDGDYWLSVLEERA
jgi:hypothetical protein